MLGSNVSTVGGMHRGFLQAQEWSCRCIQIYTTPSRTWTVADLAPELVAGFHAARQNTGVEAVVAHVPFLVNLCAVDEGARRRSIQRLALEVSRAASLGLEAVIVHPGFRGLTSLDKALGLCCEALCEALHLASGTQVPILIENMAGQGSTICAEFRELGRVFDLLGPNNRIGLCFDTAHAFIAGYPFAGYWGYRDTLRRLFDHVGPERLRAIHLNDALTEQGSRHDRHAPPGKGRMGVAVFHALVRDPQFGNVPKVLEVPDRDRDSLPALRFLRHLEALAEPVSEAGAATQALLDLDA